MDKKKEETKKIECFECDIEEKIETKDDKKKKRMVTTTDIVSIIFSILAVLFFLIHPETGVKSFRLENSFFTANRVSLMIPIFIILSIISFMSKELFNQKKITKNEVLAVLFFGTLFYFYVKNPAKGNESLNSGVTELKNFFSMSLISGMVPAFFLAGAIVAFMSRDLIAKILGKKSNKFLSYTVASLTGFIVSVCSCGIIPVFTAIYAKGASIGPASTFLFAGPAINLLAVLYTYSYIDQVSPNMAIARIVSVIFFSILTGIIMNFLTKNPNEDVISDSKIEEKEKEGLVRKGFFFIILLIIMFLMAFPNEWYKKIAEIPILNIFYKIPELIINAVYKGVNIELLYFSTKFLLVALFVGILIYMCKRWFSKEEIDLWILKSYKHLIKLVPKIALGVFITGAIKIILPQEYILKWVGENTVTDNLFSSVMGAMLYFGTIMGITITKFFIEMGMHSGPALTLLLAGPIVTLPSIITINSVIGFKKNALYTFLVIIFSALAGFLYGKYFI
jgi:uncharacterized membrane protein YraQ (UPF0718 family)